MPYTTTTTPSIGPKCLDRRKFGKKKKVEIKIIFFKKKKKKKKKIIEHYPTSSHLPM